LECVRFIGAFRPHEEEVVLHRTLLQWHKSMNLVAPVSLPAGYWCVSFAGEDAGAPGDGWSNLEL